MTSVLRCRPSEGLGMNTLLVRIPKWLIYHDGMDSAASSQLSKPLAPFLLEDTDSFPVNLFPQEDLEETHAVVTQESVSAEVWRRSRPAFLWVAERPFTLLSSPREDLKYTHVASLPSERSMLTDRNVRRQIHHPSAQGFIVKHSQWCLFIVSDFAVLVFSERNGWLCLSADQPQS